MRTMKHFAIAAIAASALALAGCGGGGSSQTSVAPPSGGGTKTPPATPPATSASVTLPSDDNKYLTDADTMLADGTVSIAAGASTDLGAYSLSCSDAGPCEVTIADGTVTATGAVTAAYTAAAQKTIDDAKKTAADENSGRSLGMHSALTDKTGTRGQAILEGIKDNDLEIMRGMSGGSVVTDGRLGGKSGWTTGMADSAISGFEGHKLTRKTEKFVVYTDIANAKHKDYLKEYVPGATHSVSTTPVAEDNPSTTDVDETGRLTLTPAEFAAAGNAGLLDSTKFPQPKDEGEGHNTYTYDNGEGAGKKKSSFKGTFHGAPGAYNCATNDCVVRVSDRSTSSQPEYVVVTSPGGNWTFTPDTDNNPQIVNQDADYMHFGWWVETPAKAAAVGQYLYDAEMFYSGNQEFPTASNAVELLDGDADYSGPAAGLFAVTGDNAAHGEFTATATLTAKFGNTSTAGSVSGKIADFVRDDGVANDWSVTLGKANILTPNTTPTGTGNGNSTVTGGSNDNIGAWEFQMYGSGKNEADPTGIAGSFRAAIDKNTAVAGAFATKPK